MVTIMTNGYDKEHITTGDAILAINQLINKYESIISRVLKIKQDLPEGNGSFRRQNQNSALLMQLHQILLELHKKVEELEQKLITGGV